MHDEMSGKWERISFDKKIIISTEQHGHRMKIEKVIIFFLCDVKISSLRLHNFETIGGLAS